MADLFHVDGAREGGFLGVVALELEWELSEGRDGIYT